MKKIAAIKFKTEYPRIYLTTKSIYFADSNVFGQISGNELILIKDFSDLLRTVSLRDKYFYLEDYFENKRIGSMYHIKNDSFVELPILLDYRLIFGSDVYFLLANKSVPQTLLFDIEKKEVIWKIDKYFSFQIFENELLIDTENNKTIRYDFQTGNPLWQNILPEGEYDWKDKRGTKHKCEIQGIIGQNDGVLWINLNSGRILGLSIENGHLLFDLLHPNYSENNFSYHPSVFLFGSNTQLDQATSMLFGINYHYYREIDLSNPSESYKLYDISATCQENNTDAAHIRYGCFEGDEIFFSQVEFAQDPSFVGIFNRQTRQITWTSQELGEEGVFKGINKIEYQAGRLYVLDRAGTLHIFERETQDGK